MRSPTQCVIWDWHPDLSQSLLTHQDWRPEKIRPRRPQGIREAGSQRLKILEFQLSDLILTAMSERLGLFLSLHHSSECFVLSGMMLFDLLIVLTSPPGYKGCAVRMDIINLSFGEAPTIKRCVRVKRPWCVRGLGEIQNRAFRYQPKNWRATVPMEAACDAIASSASRLRDFAITCRVFHLS